MDFSGALAVSSAAIALIVAAGGWLAAILARRSAQEDHRRAENDQAWEQLIQLSEARASEIRRLSDAMVALRQESEARLDRQQTRCRIMTDTLVKAIREVRESPDTAASIAEHALRLLREHRDYHYGPSPRGEPEG